MESIIEIDHDILETYDGITITSACRFTGKEKNKYWLVKNKQSGEIYYVMDVSNNRYTIFDTTSLEKVLSLKKSWTVCNGHVVCEYERNKKISMHSLLMVNNDNEITEKSLLIHHLNNDKFDNRISNLKFITLSEQNQIRGKCKRRADAKPLPDGIQQSDLPRYVTYNAEYKKNSDGEKELFREYFRIEKHPLMNDKSWTTSKSKQYTIKQKLQQAIEYLKTLEQITENNNTIEV